MNARETALRRWRWILKHLTEIGVAIALAVLVVTMFQTCQTARQTRATAQIAAIQVRADQIGQALEDCRRRLRRAQRTTGERLVGQIRSPDLKVQQAVSAVYDGSFPEARLLLEQALGDIVRLCPQEARGIEFSAEFGDLLDRLPDDTP